MEAKINPNSFLKESIQKFKGIKIYNDKDRYEGVLPGKRLSSLNYNTKKILG